MKRIFAAAAMVIAAAFCAIMPLQAQESARIGVVFMHGKWGQPDRHISNLVGALKAEGYLVNAPEMPWSGTREYDKDMSQAMAEVDNAIRELRNQGAAKIVVGGHSMGANAALYYAGRTKVDGVAIVALGHFPEGARIRDMIGGSVARAKELVLAGKGEERGNFDDFNTGNRRKSVSCSAKNYLSYFDLDGPMNSIRNAASVKPGTPVLWVAPAQEEPGPKRMAQAAREQLPSNQTNKFVEVDADHLKAPNAAINDITAWLKALR